MRDQLPEQHDAEHDDFHDPDPPGSSVPTDETPFRRIEVGKGRKSKLSKLMKHDPEGYQKISWFIAKGVYDYVAAGGMGVHHTT